VPGPVVITGGGTAGHVFPMRAVADALFARGLGAEDLRFVGSTRGQEAQLLVGEVELVLLPGRGLRRSLRPSDLLVTARAAVGLVAAFVRATFLLRRWRPSVVVSVGGYAAFAVGAAAVLWRYPLVLVDLDATPGAVHRLLGRFARRRCSAFHISGANVVVTGAPVRADVAAIDRSPSARRAAKARVLPPLDPERVVIVVMTGSLGSARVNDAVSDLAQRWSSREDVAIIHVTGRRDYERIAARQPKRGALDYRVVAFGDMVTWWGVCDLAVCRAGSTTLAELSLLSIPALLVPLPGMSDHQTHNAEAVVASGGATLLRDEDCDAATLAASLTPLLDPSRRAAMSQATRTLAHPDAAGAIARVVDEIRVGS